MDRLCAGRLRGGDDLVTDQIGFARRRRPDMHRLVGLPDMQRFGVGVRIDRDGAYGHFARGADDAAGDFAAIGDEKGLEHRHPILNPPNPRSLTGAFSVVVKTSPSPSRVGPAALMPSPPHPP